MSLLNLSSWALPAFCSLQAAPSTASMSRAQSEQRVKSQEKQWYLTTDQPWELWKPHWSQTKGSSGSGQSLSLLLHWVQSTAGWEGSIESWTVCLLAQPRLQTSTAL